MWKIKKKQFKSKHRILLLIIILLLSSCLFFVIQSNRELSRKEIYNVVKMAIIEHEEKEERERIYKNKSKCNSSLRSLEIRWNNILGVYYDDTKDVCMVKYSLNNGDTEEAPIDEMRDIKS